MEQLITALLLLGALFVERAADGDNTEDWTINTAADKLKNYTDEIVMNPDKIEHYKEIVTNVDNHVAKSQLVMLHKISKDIAKNVSSDKTIAKMDKLNSLSKFRRTLVEQMNYLQGLEQNIG